MATWFIDWDAVHATCLYLEQSGWEAIVTVEFLLVCCCCVPWRLLLGRNSVVIYRVFGLSDKTKIYSQLWNFYLSQPTTLPSDWFTFLLFMPRRCTIHTTILSESVQTKTSAYVICDWPRGYSVLGKEASQRCQHRYGYLCPLNYGIFLFRYCSMQSCTVIRLALWLDRATVRPTEQKASVQNYKVIAACFKVISPGVKVTALPDRPKIFNAIA